MRKYIFLLPIMMMILTSCASSDKVKDEDLSVEELYNRAYEYLEKTSYAKSAETFDKVEVEHPYSKWSTQSKLMSAYAYYKAKKYDDAISSIDRFIRLHPGNPDLAYALYLRGICYFDQIAPSEKEQSATIDAKDSFMQLITMFPDSEYAEDAKSKLSLIENHLAGHQMSIGRYYLSNQEYISALNRFSDVSNNYKTTPQIEEALYREVEVYTILGLSGEAKKKEDILYKNYPNSKWSKMATELIKEE